jgi:hypothetical protein
VPRGVLRPPSRRRCDALPCRRTGSHWTWRDVSSPRSPMCRAVAQESAPPTGQGGKRQPGSTLALHSHAKAAVDHTRPGVAPAGLLSSFSPSASRRDMPVVSVQTVEEAHD